MIQRIQTLYLFLISCLLAVLFFVPIIRLIGGTEEFYIRVFGLYAVDPVQKVASTLPMGILLTIAAFLPLVILFLYRNRWLQMRLCFVEGVLLLGLQGFVIYYAFRAERLVESLPYNSVSYSVVDVIPLVCLILLYLAFRGIAKDAALIRSVDRIR